MGNDTHPPLTASLPATPSLTIPSLPIPNTHTLLTHTLYAHMTPSHTLKLGFLSPVPQICHFASFWPPLPRLPAPGYGLPAQPTQTLEVCKNLIFLNILANILWFAGRTTNPESGPRHLNCARI